MLRFAALALLALLACGGGGAVDEPDAGYNCDLDTRDEPFSAGMKKTGMLGDQFTLVSSDPAPPARNYNDWVIEIDDSSGTPIDGATLSVKPFMPDHNHGTGIVASITPVASTPGTYDANPVDLFMPGLWEITVSARPSGGGLADTDSVKFTFCISN